MYIICLRVCIYKKKKLSLEKKKKEKNSRKGRWRSLFYFLSRPKWPKFRTFCCLAGGTKFCQKLLWIVHKHCYKLSARTPFSVTRMIITYIFTVPFLATQPFTVNNNIYNLHNTHKYVPQTHWATHAHARTHTHTHARTRAHARTHARTYIHTHTHTHTHTHIFKTVLFCKEVIFLFLSHEIAFDGLGIIIIIFLLSW